MRSKDAHKQLARTSLIEGVHSSLLHSTVSVLYAVIKFQGVSLKRGTEK